MNKKDLLGDLKNKMLSDVSLPLRKGTTNLVFGVGNPETKVLLVGEGPGYWEDQKAEPFVGNAGTVLNRMLLMIGLPRAEVYITNVVHHRPPENRDPEPFEIEAYGVYLDKIIEIIDPKIIITLGRFSMAKFLPNVKISSVHGRVHRLQWRGKNLVVIPMYHPAAALRNGSVMDELKNDFLKIPEVLKEELKTEITQMNLI